MSLGQQNFLFADAIQKRGLYPPTCAGGINAFFACENSAAYETLFLVRFDASTKLCVFAKMAMCKNGYVDPCMGLHSDFLCRCKNGYVDPCMGLHSDFL